MKCRDSWLREGIFAASLTWQKHIIIYKKSCGKISVRNQLLAFCLPFVSWFSKKVLYIGGPRGGGWNPTTVYVLSTNLSRWSAINVETWSHVHYYIKYINNKGRVMTYTRIRIYVRIVHWAESTSCELFGLWLNSDSFRFVSIIYVPYL